MAALLQASTFCQRGTVRSTLHVPKLPVTRLSFPKLPPGNLVEELSYPRLNISTGRETPKNTAGNPVDSDPMVIAKLYAIKVSIEDRIEMHMNIGEQRNNWNHLLLNSINAISLSGVIMTALAATTAAAGGGTAVLSIKLSSTLLYLSATGILCVMNKIQPSQLAEEQRNAVRLFKQLHAQIETTLAVKNPTIADVKEALEKVLALDKAYPLPLLGAMLDKFPSTVEPAVWWPNRKPRREGRFGKKGKNGWSIELEEEMKEIVGVLKRRDIAEYLRLGQIALKVNKMLAISGPLLTGLAAFGSAFVGSSSYGSWATMVGVIAGALASVVNTLEHGGQVGMVFEMYRSTAGIFRLMEESIVANLEERDVERRENGELLEMDVALKLGRSLSELKDLMNTSYSSQSTDGTEEFASKLF